MKKFLSIFLLFILLMPTCFTFASSEPQPNPEETTANEAILVREDGTIAIVSTDDINIFEAPIPSNPTNTSLAPPPQKRNRSFMPSDDGMAHRVVLDENGNFLGVLFYKQ